MCVVDKTFIVPYDREFHRFVVLCEEPHALLFVSAVSSFHLSMREGETYVAFTCNICLY